MRSKSKKDADGFSALLMHELTEKDFTQIRREALTILARQHEKDEFVAVLNGFVTWLIKTKKYIAIEIPDESEVRH